ncbi:MAG TPA: oxygenase MpaB family protein [Acidimicrobiales bacterium]|jgi:uncharacterized protein (DUF2236 family)|nr:oxygenase MpaB family protein [Acidimicrobiales bacterium]
MRATPVGRPGAGTAPPADFHVADMIDGVGGFLAGAANVIMQLSWRPVGYGVLESKVDSGKVTEHPLKRARTTFTYLAVALLGTDAERLTYRRAVNRSHAQVQSGPDSPVRYNAFDPELQLWVAACLYYGTVDVIERFRGPMDAETADLLYQAVKPLGTTLQVKPEMWPADRQEFQRYWEAGIEQIAIDPPVRKYLYELATLQFMPLPVRLLQGRSNLFFTTGFLPPPFRQAMQLPWTAADDRRFNQVIRLLATVNRWVPPAVQRFPFNYFLWDFRMRVRFDRPLV